MHVTLELSGHPKANVKRVVISDTVVVGRSQTCGLQIASASVSRKHCEIRVGDDAVSVIDLGSSNGTFLNSSRLPAGEERPLPSGCRLNVGGVRFVINYESVEDASAPSNASSGQAAGAVAASEPALDDEVLLSDSGDDALSLSDEHSLGMETSGSAPSKTAGEIAELEENDSGSDRGPVFEREEPLAAGFSEEEASSDQLIAQTPAHVDADDFGEPDLDAMFADSSDDGESFAPATPEIDAKVEIDEPILEEDEDQAFAFLTDEDETAKPSSAKASDDSKLGDFLSQLSRD